MRIHLIVGFLSVLAGSNVSVANTIGTRNYTLDPEAAVVQVSVVGSEMDASKFQLLMRSLKKAGEFNKVREKTDDDGRMVICGEFAKTSDRTEIYDLIRSIDTDPEGTKLSAISKESCENKGV